MVILYAKNIVLRFILKLIIKARSIPNNDKHFNGKS